MTLPAQLPEDLFIPREDTLRELRERSIQHNLLTLIGEPGVGKSALAASWAHEQARVAFIDLANASADSPEELEQYILSHAEEADTQAPAHITALLAAHALVLDNADRLLALLPGMINRWHSRAPAMRVLLTSRQPLRMPIEQVIELGPLTMDQTQQLFLAHAKHVRPDLALTPTQHSTLRRILEELDGNPMAIEMAASRMRLLSPEQLLERMRARLDVLRRTGSTPLIGTRYETLRAAFDDAWNELPEPAQHLYCAAATARGVFTLETLEVLAGELRDEALDLLHLLLDRSLVRRAAAAAGFILPNGLRRYALELLETQPELEHTLRLRHATHFIAIAQRALVMMDAGELDRALVMIGPEVDDLVAAWHYARQHDVQAAQTLQLVFARLAATRQGTTGVLTLLGACLDLALSEPQDARAHAQRLHQRAEQLLRTGQSAAALRELDEATRIIEDRDEPRLSASLHQTMAGIHIRAGQLDAARHHYERALLCADDETRPRILARLGRVTLNLGDHTRAQEALQEALMLVRAHPEQDDSELSEAKLLAYIASLRLAQGQLEEVRSLSQEALLAARSRPDARLEASLRENLGLVAHELGDLIDAARHYALATTASPQGKHSAPATLALRLGHLALDHRQPVAARAHFETILRDPQAREVPLAYGLACLGSGLSELALGRAPHAGDLFEQALRRFQSLRLHVLEGLTSAFHALAIALVGKPGEAVELLALARGRLNQPSIWVGLTLDILALAIEAAGKPERAASLSTLADRAQEQVELACDRFEPSPHGITDARLRFAIDLAQQLARASAPDAARVDGADALPADALVVARDCSWFRLPGAPESVELRRKRVLRRLLDALITRRQIEPGGVLSAAELIQAGWPDERFTLNESAHNRLYVALNRLRAEGLEQLIQTERDGYRLDPLTPLTLLDA
jgi:predicted ATPase